MDIGQIRQGDVLLEPVAVKPPARLAPSIEVVLAKGELTGHAHRLRGTAVLDWEAAGQRYVRVLGSSPGELSHEDHDPVPALVVAPEVTYRVIPQQEWDLSNQWRKVLD